MKKKAGRKPNKIPSFESRFQMPGRYKKELQKVADRLGCGLNQAAKQIVVGHLDYENIRIKGEE